LVQAVGGVAAGAVGVAGPLVAVVGPAGRFDVLHLVAGVAPGVVLGGAGQVLGQAGQRRLGVVTGDGGGAVTQGDGGAPRQVVVGVAGRDWLTCGAIRRCLLTPYRLRLTALRGAADQTAVGVANDAPPTVGTSYRIIRLRPTTSAYCGYSIFDRLKKQLRDLQTISISLSG